MTESIRKHHWELSPTVQKAAQTRLPLRLPRPEETGLRMSAAQDPMHHAKTRPSAAVAQRVPARRTDVRVNPPLSDGELEAMARKALLHSGIRGFTKLHVEVQNRVATVFGSLPTEFERQLAMQLVRRVNGIDHVDDEISVWEVHPSAIAASSAAKRGRLHATSWVIGLGGLLAVLAAGWVLSPYFQL